jgi:thiamine pyrophosphate-dependent acetolactate synthase large subunit-like protein
MQEWHGSFDQQTRRLPAAERHFTENKLEHDPIDGHTLVARCLRELGTTHVYCVSGTPIRETFAYCLSVGIRPVGVRSQQAGVMMAAAQNYAAGRLTAISLVSAGPAVTNTVTGVLVARDNCWPIVVLGGRRPLSMRGMGSFQDLDAVPIFDSITKWSAVVESTSEIPGYLERAFIIATSGRPGPVYLDLPEEVLADAVNSYRLPGGRPQHSPSPDNQRIRRAAEVLLEAKRPAMIIGKGVRWSEPYQELSRLVNDFGIPFITSPMGRGYLPDDHPLCFNEARSLLQSKADALLVVGARLDWTFRFGTELARDAKIIQVDIQETEIGVNVAPAIGILGDAKEVLNEIVVHLVRKSAESNPRRLSEWYSTLNEARQGNRDSLAPLLKSDALPMSPHRMLREIRDFLPRDAICVLDGNVSMAAAQQVLPAYLPASRYTAGTNGCMGVGIPFGIGAKMAEPARLVMVVCGDTAFGFNAMDMETAVRHKIPIIIVVVNNEGINGALTEKAHFPAHDERVTMFQPNIRYEAIMQAFGGYGEFVDEPEQLGPALKRAARSGMPACINVKVDPNAPYPQN